MAAVEGVDPTAHIALPVALPDGFQPDDIGLFVLERGGAAVVQALQENPAPNLDGRPDIPASGLALVASPTSAAVPPVQTAGATATPFDSPAALPADALRAHPIHADDTASDILDEVRETWDHLPVWPAYNQFYPPGSVAPALPVPVGGTPPGATPGEAVTMARGAVSWEGPGPSFGGAQGAGGPVLAPRVAEGPAEAASPQPTIHGTALGTGTDAALMVVGSMALLAFVRPVLALYHRIAGGRILDQPTRRRIYDAIVAEPGIRVGTLADREDLAYTTVLRHVRTLERAGLVQGHGMGQRRWVARGAEPFARVAARVAAQGPVATSMLRFIEARTPVDLATVRRELRLCPSSASTALARLRKAGVVLVVQEGRGRRIALADPTA